SSQLDLLVDISADKVTDNGELWHPTTALPEVTLERYRSASSKLRPAAIMLPLVDRVPASLPGTSSKCSSTFATGMADYCSRMNVPRAQETDECNLQSAAKRHAYLSLVYLRVKVVFQELIFTSS
ncbi:polyketide synthase protein, partial [Pyrenophora tritici-repentis]